jgi:hypothetical protein
VDSVKVGIVLQNYPGTKLSEEELRQIGQSVEKAIAEHSKGLIKPKFIKLPSLRASGYVVFHLWCDCGCRALEETDFPWDQALTGYFLSSA